MSKPLRMMADPCSTCPYRRDTPPGIWSRDEYEKLPKYDEGHDPPAFGVFLCHHTNSTGVDTVCRGWLAVHADSIAVRLGLMTGQLTMKQVDAPCRVELYGSGTEAAVFGINGIKRPGRAAVRAMRRLESQFRKRKSKVR